VGDKVLFPSKISLLNIPAPVKIGMTAMVTVPVRDVPDVLYVPAAAVRTISGQASVTKLIPGGQVEDTHVVVGETYGSNIEIVSGLNDGDVVALLPQGPTVFPTTTSAAARR
jgi:multidrug efflux pump subunit AcrA (membrane-fusion protein)